MNPNTPDYHEIVLDHAREILFPLREKAGDEDALGKAYHSFLREEGSRIKDAHREGASGLEVASWRSALIDVVINDHFETTAQWYGKPPYTLVASGGYGRSLLNPGSDIDLQFLLHRSLGGEARKKAESRISALRTMLFDGGLQVGHGVRTIREATEFANRDHTTKTALLDARFVAGDAEIFDAFESRFFGECIAGKEVSYLKERSQVIRARHKKFGRTAHRQEPHVKLGCGGLRDYHNLIWLIWMLQRSRDLHDLVEAGQLSEIAYEEIEAAYEFLMRVRNELHYSQKNHSGDILTLRLQGLVATHLDYHGSNIIKRSEQFMRDYYHHSRSLYQHGTSLMQAFHLEIDLSSSHPVPIFGALASAFHKKKKRVRFDGFVAEDGLIFPGDTDPFRDHPRKLMRFFLHTQQRALRTSPEIRRLIKEHWDDIDDHFRKSRTNREIFEQILQNRGQVSPVLRQMHRVGFLGRYLPEFGQLTDLVQHEFFHQYTADEHTLRCIDELDRLLQSEDPGEQFHKKIFQDLEDPVAMYIALIMHDTGRAEGVRVHEDASAILASQVCQRLCYTGDRLRLIMFLVDHHLTFWRTATTKDISDRNTISEFASTVRNRTWMEALYLFTYVDSRATSEDSWNGWKASLMKQLFQQTCAYFEDRKAFNEQFHRPVSETMKKVKERLPESYEEEIEAHFRALPERYFSYRGSKSIVRHLKLFRKFLNRVGKEGFESLAPVIGWESRPDEGYTLMEVVCWNRHNLLATITGALSSRNLNVLSADIFMRDDDLVLDIFRVCTTQFRPIKSEKERRRIEKLIFDACGGNGELGKVDFPALIQKTSAPTVLSEPRHHHFTMPQRVFLTNDQSESATVLEIQAADRIGLLYDIFDVLSDLDTEVLSARISTQAGAAIDRFYLVDTITMDKITDQAKLDAIQSRVWEKVAIVENEQRKRTEALEEEE